MSKVNVSYQSIKDLVAMAKNQGRYELATGLLEDALASLYEAYCLQQDDIIKLNEKVVRQAERLSDYGWQTNPDRMGS